MFTHKIYFDEGKRVKFELKSAKTVTALEAENLEEDSEDTQVKKLCQTFKSSIKEIAKDVFTNKRNSKKHWFNEKCTEFVIKRKDAISKFLRSQNIELGEAYREINFQVNKTLGTLRI